MMIVFLDTETTALLAVEAAGVEHQPHIVEIYLLKTNYDFTGEQVYHQIIKPPVSIPEVVSKVHGITDEQVKNEKPFAAYYRSIAQFFTGVTHMVGHNLQYDKRVILYELERINKVTNFPWPIYNICTVEEIQKIKGFRMNLSDLHEELFGIRFESAHSADADTRALFRIYQEMVKRAMVSHVRI